ILFMGSVAKIVIYINGQKILEKKEYLRAASVLAGVYPIVINQKAYTIEIDAKIKSSLNQITLSADFELHVNGIVVREGEYSYFLSSEEEEKASPEPMNALNVQLQELFEMHSEGFLDDVKYKTLKKTIIEKHNQ